jgi:uncharacterized protein
LKEFLEATEMENIDYILKIEGAQRRFFDNSPEIRTEENTDIVEGLGIVYNSLSQNFAPYMDGGAYEIIEPGASRGLLDDEDIMILFNHDPNLVLARNKNTANLTETDAGVTYRYNSPNTTVANDLKENLRLKNVRKSSFAFKVKEQRFEKREWEGMGKINLRRITKFERLFDMSPVTYPAYQDTTAIKRAFQEFEINTGLPLSLRERELKLKIYK